MRKSEHIVSEMLGTNVDEVIGREYRPPYANVDADTEMEMAAKSGFTAWEYANRMNKDHPRLRQAVRGGPYEPLYRRHFGLKQEDPFYEEQQ